jgi:hypothetical protein
MHQTGTISDIKPLVIDALQGRTDITDTQIAQYVSRALIEITESYPFEELRTIGPTVALTTGQAIYPKSTFLNNADDYTSNESFALYVDYPTNTVVSTIDYKTPKAIELMIAPATQGVPSRWSRFGNDIYLGPTPNQPYSVFMRYQVKHTFSTIPSVNDPVFMTRSWYEIVAYAAAMRIAVIKRWTDQRKELHDLLYGDPEFVNSEGKRGRPGLIAARMFQVERDQKFNTRQFMPIIPRYGAR